MVVISREEELKAELKRLREDMKLKDEEKIKTHWIWYLLPVLLGFIGGIIGFFVFRKKDRSKALTLLGIGIVVSIILYFI